MRSILNTPIENLLSDSWNRIDRAYRKGFFAAVCVGILAYGFEMTNLTLHHDDVVQIFFQDAHLSWELGRFGLGWLHYYTQDAYIMPFVQMAEGIVLMGAYGVVVSHFWGVRKPMDIGLISAILTVFPFMAQIFQYNTAMATYPAAHLLVALAVVLSVRARLLHGAVAAALYVCAFSIYQAVLANAATIFIFWLLGKLVIHADDDAFLSKSTIRSTIAVALSVVVGGILYLVCVSFMNIPIESYQAADKAFSFSGEPNLSYAMAEILKGTRSFYFWPENYFPNYLKKLQLIFIVGAAIFCLWFPKGFWPKAGAVSMLVLAGFSPRLLQLLHPAGHYHNLTLTAYALVIAGTVMIINRAGTILLRNATAVLAFVLIGGYVLQCNWISTVNYLNTVAHFATVTQILARARSLPDTQWDGKTIAVVGRYEMPSDYPFKGATGVATKFLDAHHMDKIGRLMRDEVKFIPADETRPKVLEYAATHSPWPQPGSVGIVDGIGVVVLSKN